MMHHARLPGAAKEQEGLPCSQLRERTARQRGVEQLGAPRRGPRHVAPRGEGDAQPARVPDRHGGHLFDIGERRTIDEAPGAYKPIEDIIGPIADAVDIIDVMRPIYNFKAS